uniref:Uncharacterized protein n=1 Tax=Anguilla anguilla TaxID=7936 RepID=A0A0E9RLJ0_ANGAN
MYIIQCHKIQDSDRQQAQTGTMVEFAIALMAKLDGINRHSFNSFRLRVGRWTENYGHMLKNTL